MCFVFVFCSIFFSTKNLTGLVKCNLVGIICSFTPEGYSEILVVLLPTPISPYKYRAESDLQKKRERR